MLTIITDPDVLAQFPHLSPPKPRLADTLGSGALEYELDYGDPRAGHGRVALCETCGTYLRVGQVHTSALPVPHATLEMVTVYEPSLVDEHYTGNLAVELGE